MRQKTDFAAEFRIVLPDGTVKHLEATAHQVFSSLGALVEAVSSHVDVTERKRAQEENERLRQLESDLAHINRLSMMGELAASLAHEVKQPIAAGRNNARAALNFLDKRPPDRGEVREALSCIVGDADRAAQIIDRMRNHIKKAPPRKDRFDLNEAINEVIVLARGEITKNGVSVDTCLTEGALSVEGDRVQLQQVVLNLILNAVEAMGSVQERPRELLISTEQTQTNGVLLAVHDSGPGIDAKHLERVFQAFYTTKSRPLVPQFQTYVPSSRMTWPEAHQTFSSDPNSLFFTDISQLRASPGGRVYSRRHQTEPPALIDLDLNSGTDRVVRRSAKRRGPPLRSRPEPITFTTQGGETAHAFFYPPFFPRFTAPQGRR